MKYLWLIAALFVTSAHAYTAQELREDCQAADDLFAHKRTTDVYQSVKSARCISYLAGFADSYSVSDFLAEKVGVKLNAFCLPNDPELSMRLVRAVLIHIQHVPPNTTVSTAKLVAGAFAKAFPCTDTLESRK